MRIGIFTQNFRRGGLDTFLINLLKNWQNEHEIVLFCNRSHPGLDDLKRELGSSVKIVTYNFFLAQDLQNKSVVFSKLVQLFIRCIFWIVGFPYLVQSISSLFRAYSCDRLLVVNGGYPGGDACLAATVAWNRVEKGKPKAWHNFHNMTQPYSTNPFRQIKERWIDSVVARAAAGFVTVSSACLKTLELRPVLQGKTNCFIYNGIMPFHPSLDLSLRAELNLPESAAIVLMLAVYETRKGHAFIFDAMNEVVASVPHAYLLVCGDGSPEDFERVRALRDESPFRNHIILQGHRDDAARLISQADILAVPSQSQESFGYTALEAMNCGLAVVCTDVGGLPEVIEDGRTGIVVSKDDTVTFGRAVSLLLSDPARRREFCKAGRLRSRELFSVKSMVNQYMELIL